MDCNLKHVSKLILMGSSKQEAQLGILLWSSKLKPNKKHTEVRWIALGIEVMIALGEPVRSPEQYFTLVGIE